MKTILTDDEITQVFDETNGESWRSYARAIEAKILEKIGEAVAKISVINGVRLVRSNQLPNGAPLHTIPFIEVEE